jgi:predicted transcriptional regulator
MIDFACKKFKLEDVIKCGLGLSKAEFLIMSYFVKNRYFLTTKEVSKGLDLDLSTVQRSVKKLYHLDVLIRSQINLRNGYQFQYKIKSKPEIEKIIMNIVNNWAKRVDMEFSKWR